MKSQSVNSHIQNAGRYLQSLDSVRFAESDSDALIVQARVELFTALLFGQTIPIGEHQFLDSDGFIPNAVKLLESLKSLEPRDRRKVESYFPFRVGIRSELMPVDNFIGLKLGDKKYKLSRWEKLNNSPEIRMEIKKNHEKGKFSFNDLYKLLPDQEVEINELKLVRDRFLYGGKDGAFKTYYETPTIMTAGRIPLLPFGLEVLINFDESSLHEEIEQQQKLINQGMEPSVYIDPELISPCMELITLLKELKKAELLLNNRSSIRKDIDISRKIVTDDRQFEALLEIFDRLYNSAAAEAVESYSEEVSSARDSDDIYIRAGTILAELAISKIPIARDSSTGKSNKKKLLNWEFDTNFSVLHNSKAEIVMSNLPWEVIWHAYLDEDWNNSLKILNEKYIEVDNLLAHPTNDVNRLVSARNHLDDAISSHIKNISKLLMGSIIEINKDSKTGETFVGILNSVVGASTIFTAKLLIASMGITSPFSDLSATIVGLVPPITGYMIKPYIPNFAAWNTNGEISRVLKKVYKQNY